MRGAVLKKLIPSFLLLLVTAIALGATGLAWYSMNRRTDATNATLVMSEPEVAHAVVTVHRPLGVRDGVTYFDMDPDEENHALETYSILTNDNRQLLLRIAFTDVGKNDIVFKALTDTTHFMDSAHPLLPTSDGKWDAASTPAGYTGEPYDNCLSSVLSMMLVGQDAVTLGSYAATEDSFAISITGESAAFAVATPDGGMTVKNEVILAELARAELEQAVLYLVLDYDNDLVAQVFSENIANAALQSGTVTEVSFVMDFRFLLVSK